MAYGAFDAAAYYARVAAGTAERHALRQDLVRGLKDYFEHVYGYDRYGGETALLLPQTMGTPLIYGYAFARVVHDRRLSTDTKLRAAECALEIARYGGEEDVPYAFLLALTVLARSGRLPAGDLRYGLLLTVAQSRPFLGLDKTSAVELVRHLMSREDLPSAERLFWGHSLLGRYNERAGAPEMIEAVLGQPVIPVDERREVARAWVSARQPRIVVESPPREPGYRSQVVAEHLPFWVAHAHSWPQPQMVRAGLVWLARLGDDPVALAERYIDYQGPYADHLVSAVADILAEHHEVIDAQRMTALLDTGIAASGTSALRRKFYRLGASLFGPSYLERARTDSAASVRQWAGRELQR